MWNAGWGHNGAQPLCPSLPSGNVRCRNGVTECTQSFGGREGGTSRYQIAICPSERFTEPFNARFFPLQICMGRTFNSEYTINPRANLHTDRINDDRSGPGPHYIQTGWVCSL